MRELPSFLLRRSRYAEALEAARSMALLDYPHTRTLGHALAGQALIGIGDLEGARRELEALAARP
jgi:hypothetical protein